MAQSIAETAEKIKGADGVKTVQRSPAVKLASMVNNEAKEL